MDKLMLERLLTFEKLESYNPLEVYNTVKFSGVLSGEQLSVYAPDFRNFYELGKFYNVELIEHDLYGNFLDIQEVIN